MSQFEVPELLCLDLPRGVIAGRLPCPAFIQPHCTTPRTARCAAALPIAVKESREALEGQVSHYNLSVRVYHSSAAAPPACHPSPAAAATLHSPPYVNVIIAFVSLVW